MAHYLYRASYTQSGIQGILKEGGTARIPAIEALVSSVGGKIEAAYWAFGDDDFVMIAELPDNVAAASLAATVAATGTSSLSTTVLLTAADMDAVAKTHPSYRAPGA